MPWRKPLAFPASLALTIEQATPGCSMNSLVKRGLIAGVSAALSALTICVSAHAQSVLDYHGDIRRSGNFVVP